MSIRQRDATSAAWKLRGWHFLTAITAIGLIGWGPGCGTPRETGSHDTGVSAPEDLQIEYPVRLVGPLADWRPQDYSDSRGITSVWT